MEVPGPTTKWDCAAPPPYVNSGNETRKRQQFSGKRVGEAIGQERPMWDIIVVVVMMMMILVSCHILSVARFRSVTKTQLADGWKHFLSEVAVPLLALESNGQDEQAAIHIRQLSGEATYLMKHAGLLAPDTFMVVSQVCIIWVKEGRGRYLCLGHHASRSTPA